MIKIICLYLSILVALPIYGQEGDCAKRWQDLFAATNENFDQLLQGAQFLHKKNPNRHTQKEIAEIEEKLKAAGIKNPGAPERKLLAWLWEMEDELKAVKKDPAKLQKLKDKLYSRYVIAEDQIPESYFELQKKIAREQGHGNITITPDMRKQLSEVLITDQKRSLDQWIDYLMSDDTNQYPMWAKLWAFEDMVRMDKYNPELGKFAKRSNSTVAPFIELNREALGIVMDGIEKKVMGKSLSNIDPEIRQLLDKGRFSQLYGAALKKLESTKVDLTVTEGKWVKYPQGSSPDTLVNSIKECNTGWCTAGESMANKQLKGGDFYVYYSNDAEGNPKQPRIAIRMENEKIAEVRGIGKNQNMDEVIMRTDILDNKLKEFGEEGKRYKKKTSDMTKLTKIDEKVKRHEELTKEELIFLYELDEEIQGFGYTTDPRVDEILSKRDTDNDLSMIFGNERQITLEGYVGPKVSAWLEHPDRIGITVKTKSGAKFTRVKDKRFDHLGAVWKDEDSGLIWSHGAGERMKQIDAIKFCEKLGGKLPTKEMFKDLASKRGGKLFSDGYTEWCWSSSVRRDYSIQAWIFIGKDGRFDGSNRFYTFNLVRCVAQ